MEPFHGQLLKIYTINFQFDLDPIYLLAMSLILFVFSEEKL